MIPAPKDSRPIWSAGLDALRPQRGGRPDQPTKFASLEKAVDFNGILNAVINFDDTGLQAAELRQRRAESDARGPPRPDDETRG